MILKRLALGILGAFLYSNTSSARSLRVLIIDTGISKNRPELIKYVDPKYKAPYQDFHGHGTHITSIILKHACKGVVIIPCRFYKNSQGHKHLENSNKCLRLGLKLKVDFVNMSLTGIAYSEKEYDVLKLYEKAKIPVHVALGNSGHASPTKIPAYPADLDIKVLVKVGALKGRAFARYSNIRSNSIYFPGTISAASKSLKGTVEMEGTSQATAFYSGLKVKEFCKKD